MSSKPDPAAAEQNVERLIRAWADPVTEDDVRRACGQFREKLRGSGLAAPRKAPQSLLVAAAFLACLGVVVWTVSSRPGSDGSVPATSQEGSVPDEKIDAWVRELASDDVEVRERAQKALAEAVRRDPAVERALLRRVEAERDAEVRARLREIVGPHTAGPLVEGPAFQSTVPLSSAALSPSGDRAVTVDISGMIRVWSLDPPRELVSVHVNKEGKFVWMRGFSGKIIFTPDGKGLLLAAGQIVSYDAQTLKQLHSFIAPAQSYGWPFEVRADGGAILYWDAARELVLADLQGRELARYAASPGKLFNSARFSPDGALVVATQGSELQLFDGKTLKAVSDVPLAVGKIRNAAFSDDGQRWVLHTETPHELSVWDVKTRSRMGGTLAGTATWSSNFLRMVGPRVFAEVGGTLLVAEWSADRKELVPVRTLSEGKLNDFALSRDGSRLLVASRTLPTSGFRVYALKTR